MSEHTTFPTKPPPIGNGATCAIAVTPESNQVTDLKTSIENGSTTITATVGLGGDVLWRANAITRAVAIGCRAMAPEAGHDNTAIGAAALSTADTAVAANRTAIERNTVIGSRAAEGWNGGTTGTTAVDSVLVGAYAGFTADDSITSSVMHYSVSIGAYAMRDIAGDRRGSVNIGRYVNGTSDITDQYGITIGYDAGRNATGTRSHSIRMGYQAMYEAGGASTYNIMMGYRCGMRRTDISSTVGIGRSVLTNAAALPLGNISTGVFLGYNSGGTANRLTGHVSMGTYSSFKFGELKTAGTLSYNCCLGSYTGAYLGHADNIIGSAVMVGHHAGSGDIEQRYTRNADTYVGASAGRYFGSRNEGNTTAGHVAIGSYALANVGKDTATWGVTNVAIGYYAAGYIEQRNDYMVSIGGSAGRYSTNTRYNIGIGYYANGGSAAKRNQGRHGIFLGTYAGRYVETSTCLHNIGIGRSAGANMTGSASYNTLIGFGAGIAAAATPLTGEFNAVMGYYAGRRLSSGSRNVFLGSSAGAKVTTGNGNFIVSGLSSINGAADIEDSINIHDDLRFIPASGNGFEFRGSLTQLGTGHSLGLAADPWNTAFLINAPTITSDERAKHEMRDLDAKTARNILRDLKPKRFKWRKYMDSDQRDHFGFSAQQTLETDAASIVMKDTSAGANLSMRPEELIPVLLKNAQLMDAQLTKLTRRIAQLEKQLKED